MSEKSRKSRPLKTKTTTLRNVGNSSYSDAVSHHRRMASNLIRMKQMTSELTWAMLGSRTVFLVYWKTWLTDVVQNLPYLNISRSLTKFIGSQIVKKFWEILMRFPSSPRRNADVPKRNAYRVLLGKLDGKWPLGRSRHRRKDIKKDLKQIRREGVECINLVHHHQILLLLAEHRASMKSFQALRSPAIPFT